MTLYYVTGWQSYDAPHWSLAIIEAETPDAAREALLAELMSGGVETAWGWPPDGEYVAYHDAKRWQVSTAPTPLRFVLGGGCR